MRLLFATTVLLCATSFCFGQISEMTNPYPSSFVLGMSFHGMPSTSSEVRRHSLKKIEDGYYYDVSNEHKSSLLMRVKGEFQFSYLYVRGGLGIRTERANLEAHNFQEYYNFEPGENSNTEVYRDLYINQKTTSLIASIEAGSYFFRRDRPFRVGMGAGFDFCAYLPSKETGLHVLYEEERAINPTFPQTYDATTSAHSEGSPEWKEMVRDVSMPLVVPKISLKAAYRMYDNFSISLQARMRLLFLSPEDLKMKTLIEFPIGIGFHYHFLN